MKALLAAAAEAARSAGELLRGRPRTVDHKGIIDLVTEIDLASEARIREVMARRTPDIPVMGEELGGVTDGVRWVVDPLDGTTNFVHDYPAYTVSIGLCDGPEPILGAIYDPIRDRLFLAARGGGTTCNGAPVHVSETRRLIDALGVSGFPYAVREESPFYLGFVDKVLRSCQGFRRSGSAAFDFTSVACGQADFFWEFGLKPWDTAAGAVLVREAGGLVTALDGGPWVPGDRVVLASNGHLHEDLVQLLSEETV